MPGPASGQDLSATGADWQYNPPAPHLAEGLVEATGMPLALAIALAGRGITKDNAASWLAPKIRDLMPDPSILTDMDKAVDRLMVAVQSGEMIGIFGDYDVDGASSAAVLHDILTPLGCEVSIHIPDRFSEGYGPNLPALEKLKAQGCSLIVTVDCGITAHGPIAATVEAGVDVIIIDHHIAGPDLPQALAVVNPNRLEDDGRYGYLAAAGVCFLVMAGLLRGLRQQGYFKDKPEPKLMASLDLVALATVADVVPMAGLNRAYVRSGLQVMAGRERFGLAALADVARMTNAPDAYALGFLLGPRINAGGRIGHSSLGVNLMTSGDQSEAERLAAELDALNTQRKTIEQDVTAAAIAQIEQRYGDGELPPVIMAAGEDWNQGVIGISAGRLKEYFDRPAAVISISTTADGQKIGKASARSVAPFQLGAAVIAANQHGLLEAGGGHDMAAGFTINMDKIEPFQDFMISRARADFGGDAPARQITIDAPLSPQAADLGLLDWMDQAGPYGTGFENLTFLLNGVTLSPVRKIGKEQNHMALAISDGIARLDGIAFNVAGTALGDALLSASDGRPIQIIGRLNRNRFRDRVTPQLVISDIKI